MRDLIVILLVFAGAVAALRRPWIGVMLWTWLSIMSPHRLSWGWAYDMPAAAIAAGATMLGLLATPERESPFKGAAAVLLVFFMVWMTLSWLLGLGPGEDYPQWSKVMKIDFMILVSLALLRSKLHIFALAWVVVGSLALLGVKGGLFTVLTGGEHRVWGPPDSFITDNNEFALSLVMTIPLLRFLQLQLKEGWARHGMTAAMVLCGAAALGTHSRGALLALIAMATLLWWRGRSRIAGGLLMLLVGVGLMAFMPDTWTERMSTIGEYAEDRSALGRISAWWNAWNLAWHYPLGVGFDAARPELFALYSPYPDYVHAAHSIYFQVLGNHGFVGLLLFLAIWIATWRDAGWLRRRATAPEAQWAADLGAMCQVALLGYAVGGAFLSLSYFDLPYDIMVLALLSRRWVERRAWRDEPQPAAREARLVPGVAALGRAR